VSDHKDHIDELTPAMMQQYLAGKLSSAMQYRVERYLLDHPFEAEAMEGFAAADMTNLDSDIAQLKKELPVEKEASIVLPIWQRYWKVAAAVTVLMVSTFLILNLGEEQFNSSDEELALNKDPMVTEEAVELPDEKVMEALIDVGVEQDSVAIEEISDEEEEVIGKSTQIIEQSHLTGVKEDFDGIESGVEELKDGFESAAREESPEFVEPSEPSGFSTTADDEAPELALRDFEMLAEERVVNNKVIVKNTEPNVADQLSGRVAGVSISRKNQGDAMSPAQNKIIKGRITSQEDGTSLPGVNVIIKGTSQGAVSDFDGKYELKISD
jgi:hypothetical protein